MNPAVVLADPFELNGFGQGGAQAFGGGNPLFSRSPQDFGARSAASEDSLAGTGRILESRTMWVVQSDSMDVYRNLAAEEWLLEHGPGRPVLFLCVNAPCAVIGKNQNPWRECRLSRMAQEGVLLARRVSGGGTVYHDPGNLNAGVIVPRTEYREQKQYELIFRALEKFGIRASRLGKTSLGVDGKKFSGQAFCFRGRQVLHHGTLLVNSDLRRLERYLGSEIEGIETKAVASVPSGVMNLADAAPGLTVETLSEALKETFRELYGQGAAAEEWTCARLPEAELGPLIERNASREWRLNQTPPFEVGLEGRRVRVEKGLIVNGGGGPVPFAPPL